MKLFEVVWTGVVSGLSLVLPISDSAHDELLRWILTRYDEDYMCYLQSLWVGVVLALICMVAKDFRVAIKEKNYKLLKNVAISAAIALIGNFALNYVMIRLLDQITNAALIVVSAGLLIGGLIILNINKIVRKKSSKTELSSKEAAKFGALQLLAVIPGSSLVFASILGGRLMGLKNKFLVKYLFMASTIAVLGQTIINMVGANYEFLGDHIEAVLLGNVLSLVMAIIGIKILRWLFEKERLRIFGWYRVVLASIVAIFVLLN